MSPTPTPDKLRRPLRRFLIISLRMLLVLVALLAVWLARVTNRARLQAEVVAELKAKKCQHEFDYQHPEYEPGAKPSARLSVAQRMKREPPGRLWLRRILGDEYFREIVYASYYGRLDKRSRPGLDMRTLGPAPDEELLRKLASLGGLKGFALLGSDMSPSGFAHLARQRGLRFMTTYDCPHVTDESLAHLEGLPQLTNLNFGGCPITDRGVASLAKLPRIEVIQVHSAGLTDACFVPLRSVRTLESLILESPALTDAGLAQIRGMPSLVYLHIVSPQITDASLPHVATFTRLSSLSLDFAQISDDGLVPLEPMQTLTHLSLTPTGLPLTDRALAHVGEMTSLQVINIGNTKHPATQFSNDAVRKLVESLPNLHLLRLEPPNLAPEFVAQLKQIRPRLTVIRPVR